MTKFQITDGGADDLGVAIEQTPFSDELKLKLWDELFAIPQAFLASGDGVFQIDERAAAFTGEGTESSRCTVGEGQDALFQELQRRLRLGLPLPSPAEIRSR